MTIHRSHDMDCYGQITCSPSPTHRIKSKRCKQTICLNVICSSFWAHPVGRWQLALHFHLRPSIPLVVLGFNNEANAPAYQMSTQSSNAWLTWFTAIWQKIFPAHPKGAAAVGPLILRIEWTKLYEISVWHRHTYNRRFMFIISDNVALCWNDGNSKAIEWA